MRGVILFAVRVRRFGWLTTILWTLEDHAGRE